jgi:putative ABC transport system substrate-binding protein
VKRREFITLLGGAAATWPLAARAQQPERMRRIGWLLVLARDHPEAQARLAALRAGLAAAGWVDGRNLRIEDRWGGGETERLRAAAAELVTLKPDVIVVGGSLPLKAVLDETRTVPIVFVATAGNIEHGLVTNVARPAGNATGFTLFDDFSLAGKLLGTLKEIAPGISRVGVMMQRGNLSHADYMRVLDAEAPRLGTSVVAMSVDNAAQIEDAIGSWAREPDGGLLLPPDQFLVQHRELIIAGMARHGLPAVYSYGRFVTAGGLLSYGVEVDDLYRRAGGYVDRILKGEKPADLPVQAPTKYELALNLKTARALGLTVPDTLLARADEVIE